MLDIRTQHLLRYVIDTPVKLHLLLDLWRQTQTEYTPTQLSERLCRDVWSVTQALQEMSDDGLLVSTHTPNHGVLYRWQPRTEYVEPIKHLIASYDDPVARSIVHHTLREMAGFAAARRATSTSANLSSLS